MGKFDSMHERIVTGIFWLGAVYGILTSVGVLLL